MKTISYQKCLLIASLCVVLGVVIGRLSGENVLKMLDDKLIPVDSQPEKQGKMDERYGKYSTLNGAGGQGGGNNHSGLWGE